MYIEIGSHQSWQVEQSLPLPFEARESRVSRLGNFATRDIRAGERITVLGGEQVDGAEITRRIEAGLEGIDDSVQLGDAWYLDLDEQSNTFNHSCDPNAGFRGEYELFALCDIREGEEICYDYSTTIISQSGWTMECNCGAASCRRVIGDVRILPEEVLRRYVELDALPDFIKGKLPSLLSE